MKRLLLVIGLALAMTMMGACGDSGDTGNTGDDTGGTTSDANDDDTWTGGGGDDSSMGGDDSSMGGGDDSSMGGGDDASMGGGDDASMGGPDVDDDAGGGADPTLYEILGGEAGLTAAVTAFVGAVAADPKINGYFLNDTVDIDHVILCLTKQFAELAGSPDHVYPDEGDPADEDGCRNMTDSHAGLGISTADFNDLVGHLVDVLTGAGLSESIIGIVGGALGGLATVIVEDPDDNLTVYQRVGRKPAIAVVVDDFITRVVVGDVTLVDFFGATDVPRLTVCLIRQVCSIDGPCLYGHGVEAELNDLPCRDMASSHAGMLDANDNPVTIDDFNALVGHLVDALTEAGVLDDDIAAVGGALTPLCSDIVADPSTCEGGGGDDDPSYADVEAIFGAKCTGCHTGGGSGGHNIGNTAADSSKSANHPSCSGLNVGECTIVRIKSGQMPQGGGCSGDPATDAGKPSCLTAEEQDTVQAWVDAGAPE